MQVDEYGLPIYQHTYDIYSSMKEYCWLNQEEYNVIKVLNYMDIFSVENRENYYNDIFKNQFVISGSIDFCYSYYSRTLLIQPIFTHIPYEYIKRKIWFGTKKDIQNNVFVKPLVDTKLFTGYVVTDKSLFDYVTDNKVKEDTPLLFSEPIIIVDEYRTWVNNGHTVDLRPYYKKTDMILDKDIVKACNQFIYGYHKKPFVADYGITDKGETVLIEVNDIHGTGTYGFNGPDLWRTLINYKKRYVSNAK
jgi:hypothetical protein